MTLTRDFIADIEIRSDGTGRTVHGILVPYGVEAVVSDGGPAYREMFMPGAFARDIESRAGNYGGVKFLYQHDRTQPIGRAVELREDRVGLYGAFKVASTARGDESLELLREGVLDSFSIGFRPIDPTPDATIPRNGLVQRIKAALRESSLVTFPAYVGALVAGVRALDLSELASEAAESTAPRPDQPPAADPATAAPPATLGGLTPAQRRERLYPFLAPKEVG